MNHQRRLSFIFISIRLRMAIATTIQQMTGKGSGGYVQSGPKTVNRLLGLNDDSSSSEDSSSSSKKMKKKKKLAKKERKSSGSR